MSNSQFRILARIAIAVPLSSALNRDDFSVHSDRVSSGDRYRDDGLLLASFRHVAPYLQFDTQRRWLQVSREARQSQISEQARRRCGVLRPFPRRLRQSPSRGNRREIQQATVDKTGHRGVVRRGSETGDNFIAFDKAFQPWPAGLSRPQPKQCATSSG